MEEGGTTEAHKRVWCSVAFAAVGVADPDFRLVEVQKPMDPSIDPVKIVLGRVTVTSKPCVLESTCACCMDDFTAEDVVARLPCGHVFHEKCVMRWFLVRESSACPMCRSCCVVAGGADLSVTDVP